MIESPPICDIQDLWCFLPPDALDYTEKWLEDSLKCLRDEAEAETSSAASSDRPTLLPVNVHNHAYMRLLKWDHASDPFPEVSDTCRTRSTVRACDIRSVTHDSLDSPLSVRRRCWWTWSASRWCSRRLSSSSCSHLCSSSSIPPREKPLLACLGWWKLWKKLLMSCSQTCTRSELNVIGLHNGATAAVLVSCPAYLFFSEYFGSSCGRYLLIEQHLWLNELVCSGEGWADVWPGGATMDLQRDEGAGVAADQ